jgi:Winged helix DNA-binding domain
VVLEQLSWSGVVARRVARQALDIPARDLGPADIARVLCGVHAQVMSAAELSIARRISDANISDVRRALWEDRELVKTFGPRGTVHLLAAADLPMWTGALSAVPSSVPEHPDPVRCPPDQAEEVIAAISDALSDAELTIDDLTEALRERLGDWAVERTMDAFQVKWPRWRQLTSTAAHRGVLCFGRPNGRNVTYTHPRRWIPGFAPMGGNAGLRALVLSYLHAFGPATPQHFAKWLGIPPRAASDAFAKLAGELEEVRLEGDRCWTTAGDTGTPTEPARGVRLLPYFDAYAVVGQPRERMYPGGAAKRALSPSGQAGNYPVVLVDGVVGGVWHARRSGHRVAITVEPLRPFSAAQHRDLERDVVLVSAATEAEATLTVGTVTVGPHA